MLAGADMQASCLLRDLPRAVLMASGITLQSQALGFSSLEQLVASMPHAACLVCSSDGEHRLFPPLPSTAACCPASSSAPQPSVAQQPASSLAWAAAAVTAASQGQQQQQPPAPSPSESLNQSAKVVAAVAEAAGKLGVRPSDMADETLVSLVSAAAAASGTASLSLEALQLAAAALRAIFSCAERRIER